MTRKVRVLILSGVVGLAGVLGSGATTAKAQGFGPYGPGRGSARASPSVNPMVTAAATEVATEAVMGGSGARRGYGRGYGGGYGPIYGGGYGGGSYYYSETTTTTIIHCSSCGGYHALNAPCGGYRPAPYYPW